MASEGQSGNIWYFENTDLFQVFCPHRTKGLDSKHHFQTFEKDQFIYFSDDPSQYVYLVADGRVKIGSVSPDGKEVLKAILTQGEVFGELALLGEDRRTDFARAMDKVTICPLSLEDMEDLMKNNRPLSLRIHRLIGLRLRKAERRIESLVFRDARTRIREYLYELGVEKGQKVGYETLVKVFHTHQDIASLTATSRQTVTTVLNELRDENLITFDRRRLLIRDLQKLKP